MFFRGGRNLLYAILLFFCVGIIFLYNIPRRDEDPMRLDYVMGKPLEKINLDYKKNIFFSVKTSVKNYRTRLSLLLLTWFQTVDKDQVKTNSSVVRVFGMVNCSITIDGG